MGVEKRALSFPEDLWAELEEVAREAEVPISTLVADAVAHMLKIRAGLRGMDALDDEFGPPTEAEVAEADRLLASVGITGPPLETGWVIATKSEATQRRRKRIDDDG